MAHSQDSRSWWQPAVHFLLLGGALLLIVSIVSSRAPTEVVLTGERVQQLEAEWQRHLGRAPTPEEKDTLLAEAVEDELFFAEAIDLGLHEKDPRVRGRLESLLEFAGPGGAQQNDDPLAEALALGLHQRDALVHGWLVALGRAATLGDQEGAEGGEGAGREEALKRLRRKFSVWVEEPAREPRKDEP